MKYTMTRKHRAIESAMIQYRTEVKKKSERAGCSCHLSDERQDHDSTMRILGSYISKFSPNELLPLLPGADLPLE